MKHSEVELNEMAQKLISGGMDKDWAHEFVRGKTQTMKLKLNPLAIAKTIPELCRMGFISNGIDVMVSVPKERLEDFLDRLGKLAKGRLGIVKEDGTPATLH